MKRRVICLLFVIVIVFCGVVPVSAHTRRTHDKQLEYMIFGDEKYSSRHSNVRDKVIALEEAVYLCVDQYNGNGKQDLNDLRNRKVPHLPKTIDTINIGANAEHRYYTHLGWDHDYSNDKNVPTGWNKTWGIRKGILRETVDKELFSDVKYIAPIQWVINLFNNEHYDEKCESFCALVYYIHLISDNEAAECIDDLNSTCLLYSRDDPETPSPGIVPELIKHCEILFQDQISSYKYHGLMSRLKRINTRSVKFKYSDNGESEEEFQEYHECVEELIECIHDYIPSMLMEEDYFRESFK
ncbi:hypothetical protein SAMN02910456_02635 [Ruminococcaceae bacterium YRB3002]|nr:hypothetical protein SAMN02910456_02635 [Ruminococcaceae bacterium YRB3002]